MVSALLQAGGAREAVLFTFSDKPSMLSSVASEGFALMPEPAIMPLLPKHVHALTSARGPIVLNPGSYEIFLSSNGNVAPELFKCIAPLKVGGKLVGLVALGRGMAMPSSTTRNWELSTFYVTTWQLRFRITFCRRHWHSASLRICDCWHPSTVFTTPRWKPSLRRSMSNT